MYFARYILRVFIHDNRRKHLHQSRSTMWFCSWFLAHIKNTYRKYTVGSRARLQILQKETLAISIVVDIDVTHIQYTKERPFAVKHIHPFVSKLTDCNPASRCHCKLKIKRKYCSKQQTRNRDIKPIDVVV